MTEQARGLARGLVAVTRGASAPAFDAPLELLGDDERLQAVLGELVSATAAMLLLRADGAEWTHLLDLRDAEGRPVSIDSVAPPVRALVRAVLAQLNGHPADAEVQVGLSVRGDEPVSVLVLALLWTVTAMEWCEANDAAPPAWLVLA